MQQLRHSLPDIIRPAVEHDLDVFDILAAAIDRLVNPSDPLLD